MFKNDERYWDINLLNKWFAISSIIFLAVTVWTFIDDNDDEFKDYQREFRRLEVEIAQKKLDDQATEIEKDMSAYQEAVNIAKSEFETKKGRMNELAASLKILKDKHYDQNMQYASHKANVDELKYLVEAENAHSNHGPSYRDEYVSALDRLDLSLIHI